MSTGYLPYKKEVRSCEYIDHKRKGKKDVYGIIAKKVKKTSIV